MGTLSGGWRIIHTMGHKIVWAWVLTIPASGAIGALAYLGTSALFGG